MRGIGLLALVSVAACQPDAPKASAEQLFPEDGRHSIASKAGTLLMEIDETGAPKVVLDTRTMTPAEVQAFWDREKKTQ